MKKRISLFSLLIFVPIFSLQSWAQTTAPATNQTKTINEKTPDVSITATVTARELKFETVPNPTVGFPGKPAGETVWEAERENLPRPVEPGVTYRDIGIRLRISSRFADIERIVAEALGEIPPIESDSPKPPVSSENEVKSVLPPTASKRKTSFKTNNRRR